MDRSPFVGGRLTGLREGYFTHIHRYLYTHTQSIFMSLITLLLHVLTQHVSLATMLLVPLYTHSSHCYTMYWPSDLCSCRFLSVAKVAEHWSQETIETSWVLLCLLNEELCTKDFPQTSHMCGAIVCCSVKCCCNTEDIVLFCYQVICCASDLGVQV